MTCDWGVLIDNYLAVSSLLTVFNSLLYGNNAFISRVFSAMSLFSMAVSSLWVSIVVRVWSCNWSWSDLKKWRRE